MAGQCGSLSRIPSECLNQCSLPLGKYSGLEHFSWLTVTMWFLIAFRAGAV